MARKKLKTAEENVDLQASAADIPAAAGEGEFVDGSHPHLGLDNPASDGSLPPNLNTTLSAAQQTEGEPNAKIELPPGTPPFVGGDDPVAQGAQTGGARAVDVGLPAPKSGRDIIDPAQIPDTHVLINGRLVIKSSLNGGPIEGQSQAVAPVAWGQKNDGAMPPPIAPDELDPNRHRPPGFRKRRDDLQEMFRKENAGGDGRDTIAGQRKVQKSCPQCGNLGPHSATKVSHQDFDGNHIENFRVICAACTQHFTHKTTEPILQEAEASS